jgi:hypothetical protein
MSRLRKDEAGIATRAWPLKFQLLAALGALRGLGRSVHGLVVADGLGLGINPRARFRSLSSELLGIATQKGEAGVSTPIAC